MWYRRLIKLGIAIIAVVTLLILQAVPVYAITNPNAISIDSYEVYQNVFEDGDILFYTSYSLLFTSEPTELASTVYALQLYDTTGTVLIVQNDIPYWQRAIGSIYFSAADVATYGIVWNTGYNLKLASKPPYSLSADQVSLTGAYNTGSHAVAVALISDQLVNDIYRIEVESGTTYTTLSSNGARLLNTAGANLASAGIPGIGNITSIYSYSISSYVINRESVNRDLVAQTQGFQDIYISDSSANWYGTSINLTYNRTVGNQAVQDTVASAGIGTTYNMIYDPSGSWALQNSGNLTLDVENTLGSGNFTTSRLYITDINGASKYWNINLPTNQWYTLSYNVSAPADGTVGVINLSVTDNITLRFVAAETTAFIVIVDNIKAYNQTPSKAGSYFTKMIEGWSQELGGVGIEEIALLGGVILAILTASVVWLRSGKTELAFLVGIQWFPMLAGVGWFPYSWLFLMIIIDAIILVWLWMR